MLGLSLKTEHNILNVHNNINSINFMSTGQVIRGKIRTASTSQQTQIICITFVQCRTNVEDAGPTLYKCYTYVLCLVGDPFKGH